MKLRVLVCLLVVGCFGPKKPNCAFLCGGVANECPDGYMCGSDDRCHLVEDGVMQACEDDLPSDGAAVDAMADAMVDASGDDASAPDAPPPDMPSEAQLEIDPVDHDYGSVVMGQSADQIFTVTNVGGSTSGTLATNIMAGQFAVTADACDGTTLAAGADCTVTVTYSPDAVGAADSTLQVDGTPGGAVTAPLHGTGLAPGALSISPGSHGFGSILQGTSTAGFTFTVTNTGGAATGTIAISLSGSDASQFEIMNDTCDGMTLGGGANCTLDLVFSPTTAGSKSASLVATASPGGSDTASLTGTGLAPASLSIVPISHDFMGVETGTFEDSMFMVMNTGGVASGIIDMSIGGPDAGQFSLPVDACDGISLPAGGGACAFTVRFSPTSAGSKTALVTADATPGGSPSATVAGNGLDPANLSLTPTTNPYGDIVVGASSGTATFTLMNTGDVASGTISTSLAGTDPGQFAIVTDGCDGMSIGGGGMCTITVRFAPTTTGAKSATLGATASSGGSDSSSLTGTGVNAFTIMPAPYDYGTVATATDQIFTVTNTSAISTGTISTSLTGDAAFSVMTDNCNGMTLVASGMCTITITFTPVAATTSNGTLAVSASPGGSASSTLTGTGP